MTAKQIIEDIKWRINDDKENIKWYQKQLENSPNDESLKDKMSIRIIQMEAKEMILRGFGLL